MLFIASTYIYDNAAAVAKFNAYKGEFKQAEPLTILESNLEDLGCRLIEHVASLPQVAFHDTLVEQLLVETNCYGDAIFTIKKTSSNNIFVEGYVDTNGDPDELLYFVAYSGTRGRFQLEREMAIEDIPQIFAECNDWELYKTSGDEEMMPWETEADFIIRISKEWLESLKAGKPDAELHTKIRKRAYIAYKAMTTCGSDHNQTHAAVIEAWDSINDAPDRLMPKIQKIQKMHSEINVF